jgi:hypothetical protein
MNMARRNRRLYPGGKYVDASGVLHTVRVTDLPVIHAEDLRDYPDPGTADFPTVAPQPFPPPTAQEMDEAYAAWLERQPADDVCFQSHTRRD